MLVNVVLYGVRPLFMNRMSMEALEGLRDKTKKKPKAAGAPDPQEEAAAKVYTVDGKPVLPVENLMSCLIEAGKFIRLDGKRQLSTSTSSILPGYLHITTSVLWLREPETGDPPSWGIASWKYDLRQGRNPNGGEAVAIVRPRFDKWAVAFQISVNTDAMPLDTYRRLFDQAGLAVGIGDYRPQRKGIFGQFRVDRWEVAE